MKAGKGSRIELIDAARGVCIILMLAYHWGFDLVYFKLWPQWILYNPLLYVLEPFFAGMFIMISGISSRFSESNVKRGLKTAAAAALVSVVTYFTGLFVQFGILHLLSFSMVFYGVFGKQIDRLPEKAAPYIYLLLFAVSYIALRPDFNVRYLWWLGFSDPEFYSSDYFPVLPWIFIFLFGTRLGITVKERRLPSWFYTWKVPVLPAIGRKSLIIYLLHQPVLYGLTYVLSVLLHA